MPTERAPVCEELGNDTTPVSAARAISEIVAGIKPSTEAELAEYEAAQQQRQQAQRQDCFVRQVGRRYVDCTLENYQATDGKQRSVLNRLRVYTKHLREHISAGDGLILYGPVGTGKDHLMAAVLRIVASQGIARYRWISGVDLYGRMRDRIGSRAMDHNEETLIREFVSPVVLALSDPIPPTGKLTDFNTQMLYRIIDARYRKCLPTWVTVNVSRRDEADALLSAPVFDRLRHEALTLFCNWETHRKSLLEIEGDA